MILVVKGRKVRVHCEQIDWMQMISDLYFPVSLASINHSLMLAGTKSYH
jgi:hypothetical protein